MGRGMRSHLEFCCWADSLILDSGGYHFLRVGRDIVSRGVVPISSLGGGREREGSGEREGIDRITIA